MNSLNLGPVFASPVIWLSFINIHLAHITTIELSWGG